jgi:Uma2 family endonuclease
MSTAPKHRMTAEEYLAFDRASRTRHEFYWGDVHAMSGASPDHIRIVHNLIKSFEDRLEGSRCQTFSSELRVRVNPSGMYAYPDFLVVCGERRYLETRPLTLLNPTLIVEVISESTELYDRGLKSIQYRRIESLRAYVLISQKSMVVEWHTRTDDDDRWMIHVTVGPDGVLDLPDTLALPIAIPLSAIYDRVDAEIPTFDTEAR